MSKVLINSFANFFGNVAKRLLPFLLIPIQLHLLGAEAFGLLSFNAVLGSIFTFLDLGLTLTANREIARIRAENPTDSDAVQDFIRTVTLLYTVVGAIIGAAAMCLSDWMARHLIDAPSLHYETIYFAVLSMGIGFAVQWPVSLYVAILQGLERQVQVNLFSTLIRVADGVGSILVIIVWRQIEAFFVWLMFVRVVETLGLVWLTKRYSTNGGRANGKFQLQILRSMWRFALSVNAMVVLDSTLGQLDRVLSTTMLSIDQAGYYAISSVTARVLGMFSGSILPATTPRLVDMWTHHEMERFQNAFRQETRILGFINTGIALFFLVAAMPILSLWTRSPEATAAAVTSMQIISVGSIFNTLYSAQVQLAFVTGQPKIIAPIYCLSYLLMGIVSFLLLPSFGIAGIAVGWSISRLLPFLLLPLALQRRLRQGRFLRWFLDDTLPQMSIGVMCFGLAFAMSSQIQAENPLMVIAVPLILSVFASILFVALNCVFKLVPISLFAPIIMRFSRSRWIIGKKACVGAPDL